MASTKTGIDFKNVSPQRKASEKSTDIVSPGQTVVICGGGVIGTSIAYHLAEKGVPATVVERCEIACAASGKAGGFLAYDWNDNGPIQELSRKSFQMHVKLGETLQGTDFRKMDTLSMEASDRETPRTKQGLANVPSWVDGKVHRCSSLGSTETTAQVHPGKLSKAFMDAACVKGAQVKIGTVNGIELSADKSKVIGVKVDDTVIPTDVVVIAMGPWSGMASEWGLGVPKITGQKVHSITMTPKVPISPHALFLEYARHTGEQYEPEVYPRPDGEVYICGMSDPTPVPDDPNLVKPIEESCKKLKEIANGLSTALNDAPLKEMQACYLPISPFGAPCIGKLPKVKGAYIAAGHSCWGILNAPATGAAMAELIVDGKSSIDLSSFDPAMD